ncbi:NADP-dependent oxidoreductase [Actinoplanes sp. CA-054009]
MKAVLVHRYGPPEEYTIGEVATPHAGPGQIQVRVAAASVNAIDLKIATGRDRHRADVTFPHIPGNDFAGTVTEVGDGVTAYRIGDEVFGFGLPRAMAGFLPWPSSTTGSLAEFAVLDAASPLIAHRPPTMDAVTAAARPSAGVTANAMLSRAAVRPGETVLVIGATGGLGTMLLPSLRAARVVATGRPGDEELLHRLGATEVIGYDDYPSGVDVILNAAVPSDRLATAARCLKPGGRLFSAVWPAPKPEYLDRDDVVFEMPLDLARGVAETVALTPHIGRRYPPGEAVRALQDFTHDHIPGKLVVDYR